MSRLLKSSGAVAIATLISRVLGFARESVYAGFMGTGFVADAFYYALAIPNLFRRLLGAGALTAAFIPIFKDKEANEGDEAMWHAANAVISGLVVVSAGIVSVIVLLLTFAIHFIPLTAQHELIAHLLRLMFPYVGLVCVAAVFVGILNARGRYFLPALGTTILNVVMIGAVFFLAPLFGVTKAEQIFGLAVGLIIAGFLQGVVQLPSLYQSGFRYRWVTPWKDPTVRQVIRKMAPATLGVAAYQINVVLTQTIALSSGDRIVSSFNYAVRLMELPQGVVGISLATYLLTELSGLASEKKFPEFRSTLREGLLQLVFINALATALLVVLAEPMIRLLFQHGRFVESDTPLAAVALTCLAPGLLAFSLNNILARTFYALGDTRTPMNISVACLSLNLAFAMVFVPSFRQAGMGLANTFSSVTNTVLLFYALKRALPKFSLRELVPNVMSVLGAAVMAGIVAWASHRQWELWQGHAHLVSRFVGVFGPIALASSVYLGVAYWLKLPQAHDLVMTVLGIVRRSKPNPPPSPPPTSSNPS
jgi:putative peptidoglycan lipid II flippase